MANKSKQKGTAAETRVVRFLQSRGIEAERKALSGSEDKGDIKVDGNIIFEVKSGKQTINPTRTQLEEWMRQSNKEGKNSGSSDYLVIARHSKNPKDYDVWEHNPNDHSIEWKHWYLDEWCIDFSQKKGE